MRTPIYIIAAFLSLTTASIPASWAQSLEANPNAFGEIANKASPAVVSISAVRQAEATEATNSREQMGMGSGVIIRKDGIVITNNHVVENSQKVTVSLDEKQKLKAKVIGTDDKSDIAVLRIENPPKNLPVIEWGDSNGVKVGDWVVAIGSPFGLIRSVTKGIVSAKGRGHMGVFDIEDFIQTDAAINPGNSGGPLLNTQGQMIGINAAIFSQSGGFMGIGFSIPSNLAKQVATDIITNGRVIRGWIGVSAQNIDKELADFFKVQENKGALISQVTRTGPAGAAGIQPGDVITSFNGQPINDSTELRNAVTKTRAGTTVPIAIVRKNKNQEIRLTVREQAIEHPIAQQAGRVANQNAQPKEKIGVELQDLPPDLAKFLKTPNYGGALIVDVLPGSPAFEAGLTPGDVILKANDQNIGSAKEFESFAKKMSDKDVAVLYVQRGPDSKIFIPLKRVV